MKIFAFLLMSAISANIPKTLVGKWTLVRIETKHGTLHPKEGKYNLRFFEDQLKYNLEVNNCIADSFLVSPKRIRIYGSYCTKICCDGRGDSISKFIDYSGYYHFEKGMLTIENAKGKMVLSR